MGVELELRAHAREGLGVVSARVPLECGTMPKHAGSVFSVDVTDLETVGQPAYERICSRIRAAITSGALAPNARLPSSRMLAKDLGVARNTVDWALSQLVADGYIVRRRGAGSSVAERLPERDVAPRARKRVASPK